MAPPSNLPSALRVSRQCFDKHTIIEPLDPALRDDLNLLAGHFYAAGDFVNTFLDLVPWNELLGIPNTGHAAIADLLITRGAHAAMSANFDPLIEHWAQERKVDMQGALDGRTATKYAAKLSPLLKFHGCLQLDREHTLWTTEQLAEPLIQNRIATCSQWMNLHLPGKHLVVVGFWTDWGYLNQALSDALSTGSAQSVTVVDPDTSTNLEMKAPEMWKNLRALSNSFHHEQRSGAEFLNDLRLEFSKTWLTKFYSLGVTLMTALGYGANIPPLHGFSVDEIYQVRQDAEGVSHMHAASLKAPRPDSSHAAFVHLRVRHLGGTQEGSWLRLGGKTIRVVNGAGQGLADVKSRFREPYTVPQSDYVVCAGSVDLGVPGTLISTGRGASIVRPAAGAGANWLTSSEAATVLGL